MHDGIVFYGSKIVTVSNGITKYDAILSGLNLFTQSINYTAAEEFDNNVLDGFSTISKQVLSQSFGKISFESRIEGTIKEIGTDLTAELVEIFEEYVIVKYEYRNKYFSYSYFFQEESEKIPVRYLDINERNCNIDCLLKELKSIGFHYEFYFDESQVWFLLEKETIYSNLKAKIKKYKEMVDDGLINREDYEAKKKELLGL